MQVKDLWHITREDGTQYSKAFFVSGHTATIENGDTKISFFGPKGNKTNKYETVVNGSNAISEYCEKAE